MAPTFAEHLTLAQQHPSYWSFLTTLEFIDALVAEMDAQGINGAELARRMGTSRAWVSRVLAGECNLTVATMGKLAFALGMRVTTQIVPLDAAAGAHVDSRGTRPRKSA
jgi:transcriptional regulator with XRE-family HTH domain